MKGFQLPSTRTTNSIRLTLGSQYSLYENYIKRAHLPWGLKQVLDTNLIPLRTKFDTPTKRMPAWPVISQLWLPESHFSANGISLCLGEVQMKICKGWLQALLSPAPRGFAARSVARSRETRFTRPNRRACSQAKILTVIVSFRLMTDGTGACCVITMRENSLSRSAICLKVSECNWLSHYVVSKFSQVRVIEG